MNPIIDWGQAEHLLPLAVDTLVFTFRVLAGVLSIIALWDWVKTRRKAEFPPYDRHRNEKAWNWAYIGCAVGAVSFIALDFEYRRVTGEAVSDLFVAVVWCCWANAVTVRMSSRVQRPFYVYLASSIFIVGGFTYSFLAGG